MFYRLHKDDLVSDGVLNVSKEIECTSSNHAQEQAAFRIFTQSFHLGKKKEENTREIISQFLIQNFLGRIEDNESRIWLSSRDSSN